MLKTPDKRTTYINRGPQLLLESMPIPVDSLGFGDDIECDTWLDEVGLRQYSETFLLNCSVGGNCLSRKRLKDIRLKDFPQMNITNYEHAKMLLEHIRHTLRFQFNSPVRKNEVMVRLGSPEGVNLLSLPPIDDKTALMHNLAELHIDGSKRRANHQQLASNNRRKTFDSHAWQSIQHYRKQSTNDLNLTLENLRDGKFDAPESSRGDKSNRSGRRRSSIFDHESVEHSSKSKAIAYGNLALEQNLMTKQLKKLQQEHLSYYKNIINCEKASIFFVNDTKHELLLFAEDIWYKLSMDHGIAAHCARTGETLNIPDAYADPRFNREMDKKTGNRTRNILCQPIIGRSGTVIAVVQMLNKKDADCFGEHDKEALAACVERIADDLNEKFTDLIRVTEKLAAHSLGGRR